MIAPRAAAVALAGAVVFGGCGGSTAAKRRASTPATSSPTTTATTTAGPSIDGCLSPGPNTRLVRFSAPGEQVRAAVVGTGPVGVVLANQSDNRVCQWLPFPAFLAAHGMRVLAFDYGNGDGSAEVQGAARYLRATGARRLVLIGASLGGAIVIDAGDHLRPAPAAVVSLSAVPEATLYQFPQDARRLRSPIFQIGATQDPLTQYGQVTRDLFRESPSGAKRLLLIPSGSHGVDFVNSTAGNSVRQAILAFIRAHTGATA